ncbi:unnamed protein product [Caenorhabditis brenneri]
MVVDVQQQVVHGHNLCGQKDGELTQMRDQCADQALLIEELQREIRELKNHIQQPVSILSSLRFNNNSSLFFFVGIDGFACLGVKPSRWTASWWEWVHLTRCSRSDSPSMFLGTLRHGHTPNFALLPFKSGGKNPLIPLENLQWQTAIQRLELNQDTKEFLKFGLMRSIDKCERERTMEKEGTQNPRPLHNGEVG